jgi:hypothetical protein
MQAIFSNRASQFLSSVQISTGKEINIDQSDIQGETFRLTSALGFGRSLHFEA